MIQMFISFTIFIGTVVGARWLWKNPGEATIHWFGYDVTLHIVVVAAFLLALIFTVSMLAIGIWQLLTWKKRRMARKRYHTLESGLKQLTLGVTALAMGDENSAQEALKKASLALPNAPLPQLLTAQLLQRQGKHEDAQAQFRQLMQHEVTQPLAIRRLIEQHATASEWLEATRLAEEARQKTPKDRWLILTLIDLYARDRNSSAMLSLTEGWQWQSPLSKEERHRYAAVAHYLAALKQPDAHKKEQSLRHAVGYAPGFLPAIIDFAEVLISEDQQRRARKWLRTAWEKAPSLLLIEPIITSIADTSARAQSRLIRTFMKGEIGATHHLLMAQHAFDREALEEAKTAAEKSLSLLETKSACSLMAEIQKKLHGPDAANRWLARALEASADETWICNDCGAHHESWRSHCSSCHHFDSLRYERPEARITSVELTSTKN